MSLKTVLFVFGTRPEAIKMCPLINEFKLRKIYQIVVVVTGQHRKMLDQVLNTFHIIPDYDLSIMKDQQTLFDITTSVLAGLKPILEDINPELVLVHGDTTTTFAASLASFYLKIPVGHIEAGLRTYNIFSPYPEEFNRKAVSIMTTYNFAPTLISRENLLKEGYNSESIYITGNTAIDALKTTIQSDYSHPELLWANNSRLILITAHRRENLGEPMYNMFRAIRRVLEEHSDVKAIYPIHFNPIVRKAAEDVFGAFANNNQENQMHLIDPLDVLDFHNFMNHSYLILTDSGGFSTPLISI